MTWTEICEKYDTQPNNDIKLPNFHQILEENLVHSQHEQNWAARYEIGLDKNIGVSTRINVRCAMWCIGGDDIHLGFCI